MQITLNLLKIVAPDTSNDVLQSYLVPMNKVCTKYAINTSAERLASFLAQVAHESGGFTATKENLNYSTDGLRKVFGKYFPSTSMAAQYARKPMQIANKVYADRMGNGPERSGDGFKYRGRGLIQLTGKTNYSSIAKDLNMSIDDCVAYLETPDGIVESAGWFWNKNKLNNYCDHSDFTGLTKAINGGTNGLDDRKQKHDPKEIK